MNGTYVRDKLYSTLFVLLRATNDVNLIKIVRTVFSKIDLF